MRTFPSQQIIYVFARLCYCCIYFKPFKKSPWNEHGNSQLSKEGKHSTA